jgi:hypothetical protein
MPSFDKLAPLGWEEIVPVPEPIPVEECYPDKKEYRRSKQQVLQEYEITLKFLSRGCVVNVGCKSIAFETEESAMKELNEYVTNPWETQKKWRNLLDN